MKSQNITVKDKETVSILANMRRDHEILVKLKKDKDFKDNERNQQNMAKGSRQVVCELNEEGKNLLDNILLENIKSEL